MYRRLPAGKGRVDPKGVVEAQVPARRRRYDFFSRPVSLWWLRGETEYRINREDTKSATDSPRICLKEEGISGTIEGAGGLGSHLKIRNSFNQNGGELDSTGVKRPVEACRALRDSLKSWKLKNNC